MNIVDFAHQILELEEDRNYWRREALHYKSMHEESMLDLDKRVQMNTEHLATILTAAIDPNSGINRMARAMSRDPLKGECK